ncbi:hypothetical protein OG914_04220 [Streptomyces sp. NBC_00291]|uniref:hypothetical protein n=1 Tax=Streptomyces sp. NBC_00291 TaxID=2975704 RepID=UPI002259E644|nr:hypothetical protein [Streptomyces sp. NBC_00291]MCX5153219.1 hypothetical protein [Streptomyces sp. NBC_00291]
MRPAEALEIEYATLSEFKKLVDTQLEKLSGSSADAGRLESKTLPAGVLGKGFAEAELLFKSYNTVLTQLTTLSKGLADQIEGLGIAIRTAGKGYGGVDEDTKARMRAIAEQAKKAYVPERDPLANHKKDAPAGTGSESTSEGEL